VIDHVWTVVCLNSVIDQESNNISLLNVIEQLTIHGEPSPDRALPSSLEVVTLVSRHSLADTATGNARIEFVSPSGEVLLHSDHAVDLEEYIRFRWRWRIQGLPVRRSGRHLFRVFLQQADGSEWEQVSEVPLQVNFEPAGEGGNNGG
jgi:hypothetical protein